MITIPIPDTSPLKINFTPNEHKTISIDWQYSLEKESYHKNEVQFF